MMLLLAVEQTCEASLQILNLGGALCVMECVAPGRLEFVDPGKAGKLSWKIELWGRPKKWVPPPQLSAQTRETLSSPTRLVFYVSIWKVCEPGLF